MKLKTLLVILMAFTGIVHAQDTIRSLIISEACLRNNTWAYVELTNMGDKDVQLADFTLGRIDPWAVPQLILPAWAGYPDFPTTMYGYRKRL
jgi:hypothetical protein